MTIEIGINPDVLDAFCDAILKAASLHNPQEESVEDFLRTVETASHTLPTDHLRAVDRERLDSLVALLKDRAEALP